MSAYLLGLLTVPAVVLLSTGAWLLARTVIVATGWTALVVLPTSNRQRNRAAAIINAADSVRFIGGGQTVVLVARRLDGDAMKAAYDLLNREGPHRDVRLSEVVRTTTEQPDDRSER